MTFQGNTNEAYLRNWQEKNASLKNHKAQLNGIEIEVAEGVFSPLPQLTNSTKMLMDKLNIVEQMKVADIGTGTGILSIYAAARGAQKVVSVDISQKAISCAKQNIAKHNFGNKIKVYQSDLFKNIIGSFDLILANLPIVSTPYNNQTYRNFLDNAKYFLEDNGEILLTSASFGSTRYLEQLINDSGYKCEKFNQLKFNLEWYVYSLKLDKLYT